MADLTNVIKHFPTPSETYTNNLSASISAGAVTVPVNANNDYTDGDIVVLTVEPGTTNEATFTGEKASTPARFINCVWTEGNLGVGHASGSTITDYDSATHVGMISKGIKVHANQDGTLKTSAVQAALNISSAVPSDYTSLAQTATTVTQNGNRSQTLTFPGVNYTDRLSPGMRLRTVRSVAAPNQSASLNGTNQYFTKTSPAGMTFTDDFVVSAWVKMTSYGTYNEIASRYNGTSGWEFLILDSGRVSLTGTNGGAGNTSAVQSYQSIPLNKWVHITAQLDMSAFTATATTSYVMIDGVDVPANVVRTGTNPTALVQAGNLEIGSRNGGAQPFPGKLAQVAIFSAKVTQATMRGYISQGLTGTETSLISAYSFNGVATDLNTTNANNLTANGGALATNADSPFGIQGDGTISTTVDYGVIQKATYLAPDTTVVVQTPEGGTIPTSGGVASVSYSQFKSPFGFPGQEAKWTLQTLMLTDTLIGTPAIATWYYFLGAKITAPIGEWVGGYQGSSGADRGGAGRTDSSLTLSTTTSSETDRRFSNSQGSGNANVFSSAPFNVSDTLSVSAQTDYYLLGRVNQVGMNNLFLFGGAAWNAASITLKNAYL